MNVDTQDREPKIKESIDKVGVLEIENAKVPSN